MVKRVVLARGAALPSSTGLGRAHHAVESLLQRAMVPGWSKVTTLEHPIVSFAPNRLLTRWRKHPAFVSSSAEERDTVKVALVAVSSAVVTSLIDNAASPEVTLTVTLPVPE